MSQSVNDITSAGAADKEAIIVGDGIFMSRGIANSYLITTPDGDVMVNTHLPHEALQSKDRFAAVSQNPLKYIIFTQGHPDHVGGWAHFNAPGIQTIAQADHKVVREYWRNLHAFYYQRIRRIYVAPGAPEAPPPLPPEPVLTTAFIDSYSFELGGRRFELYATPEGETTDALVIWMPQSKTVLIGNLMGPFFGQAPNLYTIRGDKLRSAMRFMLSVERVLALKPEILVDGHQVFRGADFIRETITKTRDAIKYLRDRTIEGMNAGKSLWTLMDEIDLPADLQIGQAHGKVPWIVRTIWEEHAGWFRFESTTELYEVPAKAIWSDLVAIAGVPALIERAKSHADAKRPLQALHLVDIILSEVPKDLGALKVKVAALNQLIERSGGENYSELQWLVSERDDADAALDNQ